MMPPTPTYVRCRACAVVARVWGDRGGNTFAGGKLWSDGVTESAMLSPPSSSSFKCGACGVVAWQPELERVHVPDRDDDVDPIVTLEDVGPDRVAVIRIVREATGLGMLACRAFVDGAPVVLQGEFDARRIDALRAAGARVSAPMIERAELGRDAAPVTLADYPAVLASLVSTNHELDVRIEWWRADNEPRGNRWVRFPERAPAIHDNAVRIYELLAAEPTSNDRLLRAEVARQLECYDDARALLVPWTDPALAESAAKLLALVDAKRPWLAVIHWIPALSR